MKRIQICFVVLMMTTTLLLSACQPKVTATVAPTKPPEATVSLKITATKVADIQSTLTSTIAPSRTLTLAAASQTPALSSTTRTSTRTVTKSPTMPAGGIIENFDSKAGFVSSTNKSWIQDGFLYWNVARNVNAQWIYRNIPSFSGNMRLTVVGTVKSATNNCQVKAGVGSGPGKGLSLDFGYFGGGCSFGTPIIMVSGATMDYYDKGNCVYSGNWLKIKYNTAYKAVLTLTGSKVNVSVSGVGSANGTTTYTGPFNLLYVGLDGDGDWPSCTGTIDQMIIEPLK